MTQRIPTISAVLLALPLCACDKLQQQGPPPSFQSSTVDVARSLSGTQPEAPSSAASSPAAK